MRLRSLTTVSALALVAIASASRAQNAPHLAYALPAGGRQGTTVSVVVGGQYLQNARAADVSGEGVEVTVGAHTRPMPAKEATQLRDRLQELQKEPKNEEVRKEVADIRMKLLLHRLGRQTSPALAETVTLELTLAPGALPGSRELRLLTPQGLSNPLVFRVGQLPEASEKETLDVDLQPAEAPPSGRQNRRKEPGNPQPGDPQSGGRAAGGRQPRVNEPATDLAITLPTVVNGRIKPRLVEATGGGRQGPEARQGDADRYRFEARRGQHLVVVASARELIPYLADAVPGWFQAVVALYGPDGKELAYDDDFRFHPDPVLHCEIPQDGEYAIVVRDALYRGREDFVYRITAGELPFVTGVFPLGVRAGAEAEVRLFGFNLPSDRLKVDARRLAPGTHPVWVSRDSLRSNEVPLAVGTLPQSLEKEPNDEARSAKRIELPVVVDGRIDEPRDTDVFAFEGRAGEEIVAEVLARRLDSPLDSLLALTDAGGRQLAVNDDHEDKGSGLDTHHADSLLGITLPANGTYYVHVSDAQQKGGPEYAYRLRVSRPQPDFELRVAPSTINVPAGGTVAFAVHALRRDGFSGDIALSLKDAPGGFRLGGAVLPAGQDKVRLTLTAPPRRLEEPAEVRLVGRAEIGGRPAERLAVPAEDMMQAFAYRHLVPAQQLRVAVRGGGAGRGDTRATRFLEVPTLKIPVGGAARVRLQTPPVPRFVGKVQLELSDPPEGITLRDQSSAEPGLELVFAADAAKVKPGLRGNLIVNVSGEREPSPDGKGPKNRARVPLGTLPAVTFEIVAN
jgi:hypothetical protein